MIRPRDAAGFAITGVVVTSVAGIRLGERAAICVIFATLARFFIRATVAGDFCV